MSERHSNYQFKGTTPLFEYFSAYPTFTYNPNASPTSEFYRMCNHFHWNRYDEDREDAYQSFRIALTKEFNNKYGTDVDDLAAWQSLCVRLGVDPVPEKIKQCRQVCSRGSSESIAVGLTFTTDSDHHPC